MKKVLIVGCGAAGMMAAISAAENGNKVCVIEKNEKAGKKLFITGKGRCNITNACDVDDLFANIVTNNKFMYSAIYSYTNQDVIDFFGSNGCSTKIERGNRVFPVSDKSSDVIAALTGKMKRLGVEIIYNCNVDKVNVKDNTFDSIDVVYSNGKTGNIKGDSIIIATGGLSYPSTGSTGDGYEFAKKAGHTVTNLKPSLVPVNLKGGEYKELQGLSLKNVELKIKTEKKELFCERGEMLFTHFGISGPLVLSGSCYIVKALEAKKKPAYIKMCIDLKPALTIEQLDDRILRDFESCMNKEFKNSLDNLLPRKIISVIIERSGIDKYKKVNAITKSERGRLAQVIKNLEYEFHSLREYNEAIITKGGIKVSEINPSTMESKIVKNLYFAGEVIDVDAYTGGFNLQIAWSTGHLAGSSQ